MEVWLSVIAQEPAARLSSTLCGVMIELRCRPLCEIIVEAQSIEIVECVDQRPDFTL